MASMVLLTVERRSSFCCPTGTSVMTVGYISLSRSLVLMASMARSRSFEVKFLDKLPLTLAMSLPSSVGITKIDLENSAKMLFQTLKMAAIFRGQGDLR